MAASPKSMAGLPARRAWVRVAPPVSANGPRSGSATTWSDAPAKHVTSVNTLLWSATSVTTPGPKGAKKQFFPALDTMLLASVSVALLSPKVPTNRSAGPPAGDTLSAAVTPVRLTVPSVMDSAPPCHPVDVLPLIVLLTISASPSERMPSPTSLETLPLIVPPARAVSKTGVVPLGQLVADGA